MTKGLCIKSDNTEVTIQYTGEPPQEGKYYTLEEYQQGTDAQRRAREPLIREYWKSGLHPKYGGEPFSKFRDYLKVSLGQGMEKFFYGYFSDGKIIQGECALWKDVPEDCRRLHKEGKAFAVGKLKSFSKYSVKQMSDFVDNLIDDMASAGVNSKKFYQIVDGMKSNEEKIRGVFE